MATDETQFVITAPGEEGRAIAYALGARQTLPVIVELLGGARERITIVAPYLYVTPEMLNDVLGVAMKAALERSVRIQIATTSESLELWDRISPAEHLTRQIEWYSPGTDTREASRLVSHAKFVVADSNRAYLGSANLTLQGLTAQYEMGIEVGGEVAARVSAFWDLLVHKGVFVHCERPHGR